MWSEPRNVHALLYLDVLEKNWYLLRELNWWHHSAESPLHGSSHNSDRSTVAQRTKVQLHFPLRTQHPHLLGQLERSVYIEKTIVEVLEITGRVSSLLVMPQRKLADLWNYPLANDQKSPLVCAHWRSGRLPLTSCARTRGMNQQLAAQVDCSDRVGIKKGLLDHSITTRETGLSGTWKEADPAKGCRITDKS